MNNLTSAFGIFNKGLITPISVEEPSFEPLGVNEIKV